MPEAVGYTVRAPGDRLGPGLGLDGAFAHLAVVLIESYYICFH